MNFAALRALVRRDIIVDQYEDAFTDQAIRDVLWQTSVEVAAAFDIPRAMTNVVLAAGATSIALTARKVHSVVVAGYDTTSVDMPMILRMRSGANRVPRYFNFDPRRSDSIQLAPPSLGGTAVIEYTAALAEPAGPSEMDAAEVWDGVLPEFHVVVAYRAASVLLQMDERENEAAYWMQEYQTRVSELAAFLGRTDVANLVIQPELRHDEGARG